MTESEKILEKKLGLHVKKLGGLSLKLLSPFYTGWPDRTILLPEGKMLFVEVKTTNKKPSPRQLLVHSKLRALGFTVIVMDKSEHLKLIR